MQNLIVAVGRWKAGPEKALYGLYEKRIQPRLQLKEVEEKKRLSGAELTRSEGQLLLNAVPDGARVVTLDVGGRKLSSPALAKRLEEWREAGIRDLAFLIGGAEGLDSAVLDQADLALSLGAMTWPHLLVRVLLAEQLYRAQCIAVGHPYHRR